MSITRMWPRLAAGAAVVLYVGWSLAQIQQLSRMLEIEKSRVYKLADGLELLQVTTRDKGSFDVEKLPQDRLIHAEEVKAPEALTGLPKGARVFVYAVRMDEQTRQKYDQEYRREGFLSDGGYVVVDSEGKVLSWGWSKP